MRVKETIKVKETGKIKREETSRTGGNIGEVPGSEGRVQRGNTLIKTDNSVVKA